MYYAQKLILFLCFIALTQLSYATDSSSIRPHVVAAMHQVSKVDTSNIKRQPAQYTPSGDQIAPSCPPDYALVQLKNESKKVFWGPPEDVCVSYGNCSGFGCYCAGSPHSCCAWCSAPCTSKKNIVKWQDRPQKNQPTASQENMPSVLSEVGCAPVKTVWEKVT